MIKIIPIILIILSVLNQNFVTAEENSGLSRFLPDNFNNWNLREEPQQYTGDDLFFLINGGADLFLEYGFVEVIAAKYVNNNNYINVEIYEMENHAAAFGIFTLKRYSEGFSINIGDAGSILNSFLIFTKGKYAVIVNGSDVEEDIQSEVKNIAGIIDNKIQGRGVTPDIVELLPKAELILPSVKYVEGMLGLNSVYIFGHQNIFGFDECVIADYGGHILFIMGYKSGIECSTGYKNALLAFEGNKKYSDFADLQYGKAMKDRNGEHLSMQLFDKNIVVTVSETEINFEKVMNSVKEIIN